MPTEKIWLSTETTPWEPTNVADTGILAVTSERAVYVGTRKTVEMPYSKLVNLTVYPDGLRLVAASFR